MQTTCTGLVLLTADDAACVAFCRDVIGLEVLFQLHEPDPITGFAFAGGYLLLEDGGVAKTGWDPASLPRLRFNVRDLDAAIAELRAKGVDTHREGHHWGSVARFTDSRREFGPAEARGGVWRVRPFGPGP